MKSLFAIIILALFALGFGKAYYIGPFKGTTPKDIETCGEPGSPCASLQYFNEVLRTKLKPGDVVRIAPGTYAKIGGTRHCVYFDEYSNGVTWEGRTADDKPLDDHESVVIDLTGASTEEYYKLNPCLERAICGIYARAKGIEVKDVTIRDMKFINPANGGIHIDGIANGVVLDRIRVTGGKKGGSGTFGKFKNGYDPKSIDCQDVGRTVKNIHVMDCEFDRNKGFPGGILFACSDSIIVERTYVHDACGKEDCKTCVGTLYEEGCDDHDGIVASGATNMIIRDCEVARCGEEGIDLGGHPAGKSHHIVVERCKSYDNNGANYKASGARYATFRNNYAWGDGAGFVSYSCPHHLYVYNNTFWVEKDHSLMFWEYATTTEIINNIIRNKSDRATVFVDVASSNPTVVWKNNIVINDGAGSGFGEYLGGEKNDPNCMSRGDRSCANSFEPPPLPCKHGIAAVPAKLPDNATGLALFHARGKEGQWFGKGSGSNDIWGKKPNLINVSKPDEKNLRLAATDTVAHNAGMALRNVLEDYQKEKRPMDTLWDIGADERKGRIPPVIDTTDTSDTDPTNQDSSTHLVDREWARHPGNPFELRTAYRSGQRSAFIQFAVRKPQLVDLCCYDARGVLVERVLTNRRVPSGRSVVEWRNTGLGSGVYFFVLHYAGIRKTSRLLVMK